MIDKSKAIIDRLKSISKSTGTSFQQLLLLLCQEEFLRRLSLTKYSDNFVLKGGLFIYILSYFKSRCTVDMDEHAMSFVWKASKKIGVPK